MVVQTANEKSSGPEMAALSHIPTAGGKCVHYCYIVSVGCFSRQIAVSFMTILSHSR